MGMISEEKLTESFVKAFRDVVEPGLNVLTDKVEGLSVEVGTLTTRVGGVEDRLTGVEKRLDKVEIKLTKIDDRLDRQGKTQDNLVKRMEVVESGVPVAS